MTFALIFAAFAVLSAYLVRRLGMPRLNPVSAFMLGWLPIVLLVEIPGAMSPRMTTHAWEMIFTTFASLVVGTILGNFLVREAVALDPAEHVPVNLPRLKVWHFWLTVALLAFGIQQVLAIAPLAQSLGGWQVVLGTQGGEFKDALIQDRISSVQSGFGSNLAGAISGIAGYVFFLGNAALFTGALMWEFGHRIRAIIPLIVAAAYSFLSLQRTSFFMSILLFAVSLYGIRVIRVASVNNTGDTEGQPHKIGAISTLLLSGTALIVLLVPLQIRNQGTHNAVGLQSVEQYFLGGVAGLSARDNYAPQWTAPPADNPGTLAPSPGYGSYTFTNLFTLIHRAGLDVPVAPHTLDFYPVQVFGSIFLTNTATVVADLYYDGGWLGLVCGGLALGLFGAMATRSVSRRSLSSVPLMGFFLVTLFWSFFGNALLSDVRYILAVGAASLILKNLTVKGWPVGNGMSLAGQDSLSGHDSNPVRFRASGHNRSSSERSKT